MLCSSPVRSCGPRSAYVVFCAESAQKSALLILHTEPACEVGYWLRLCVCVCVLCVCVWQVAWGRRVPAAPQQDKRAGDGSGRGSLSRFEAPRGSTHHHRNRSCDDDVEGGHPPHAHGHHHHQLEHQQPHSTQPAGDGSGYMLPANDTAQPETGTERGHASGAGGSVGSAATRLFACTECGLTATMTPVQILQHKQQHHSR